MKPRKGDRSLPVRQFALGIAAAAVVFAAAAKTTEPKPAESAPKPAAPAVKPKESAPKPAAPAVKPKEPAPNPKQIEGNIVQARLNSSREKSRSETVLRGQVRVTVDSDLDRFKRPVLYVAALYDVGGMWRLYDVVCTDQKTYGGFCMDKDHTPARISKWQPEIGKEHWTNLVYGDAKYGFFHGYHISGRAKLLGYRLELWQNGGLADSYDSEKSKLRRLGVPDDWYVKGKHHGKIVYRYPPPPTK